MRSDSNRSELGVALVTGASRGIGKAIAVHLARAGFDVAIGARTRHEGEQREHSSTVASSNTRPLPGSLESTAELVSQGAPCFTGLSGPVGPHLARRRGGNRPRTLGTDRRPRQQWALRRSRTHGPAHGHAR